MHRCVRYKTKPEETNVISKAIVIKTPNSINVSYDAVSITYDATSRSTTVFYHGLREEDRVFNQLQRNSRLCLHPLFFATVIYANHRQYISDYKCVVDGHLFYTEEQIGYAKPGALERIKIPLMEKSSQDIVDYKPLVKRLQSYRTELAGIGHVTRFSVECGDFLVKLLEEMNTFSPFNEDAMLRKLGESILHELEFSKNLSLTMMSQRQALEDRVQGQSALVSRTHSTRREISRFSKLLTYCRSSA